MIPIQNTSSKSLWSLRVAATLGSTFCIGIIAPLPFALGILGSVATSYFLHGRHCSFSSWHRHHHEWHIRTYHQPDEKLKESPGLKITLIALGTFALIQFTPQLVTSAISLVSAIAATEWMGATSFVWINHSGDRVNEAERGIFQRICQQFEHVTLNPDRQLKVLVVILNLAATYFAFTAGPVVWTTAALGQIALFAYSSFYNPDFLRREFEWIQKFNHPHIETAISCSSAILSNIDPVFTVFWVAVQSLTIVSIVLPILSSFSKSLNANSLHT